MILSNAVAAADPSPLLVVVAFASGATVGAAVCATVGSKMAAMAAVGWQAVARWIVKAAKTVRRIVKRRDQ